MSLENVITVGLRREKTRLTTFRSMMQELTRLVETAGGVVVKEFHQARSHPNPGTYIGEGKIQEIADWVKQNPAKTVVFDHDLTASQQKKIEKRIPAKIVDRTRLILDIFAQRARTKEGQLQVELAQLNYLVPRLTGSWRGYSQQMGGIGTRGPGERKIEVERRYVRERIKRLEKDIEEIREHRNHIRRHRQAVPIPQMALVGYTNVGKSTLLNALVGDKNAVFADDKLFATLDPTTRRVKLPGGRPVLFTDTVGFIQNLPPSLVAAFHATLEEITQASLLIHVVDATSDNQADQTKTVLNVIKELGAEAIPMMTVTTKVDQIPSHQKDRHDRNGAIFLSGKTGEGLANFLEEVEKELDKRLISVTLTLPHTKRKYIHDIFKTSHVLAQENNEEGTRLQLRIDPANFARLKHFLNDNTPS